MSRVELNEAGLRELLRSPVMRRAVQEQGQKIARQAAVLAPKRTGAGARSIHAEPVLQDAQWTARIGWDQAHKYLRYTDFGTRYISAQHFLEHAAHLTGRFVK